MPITQSASPTTTRRGVKVLTPFYHQFKTIVNPSFTRERACKRFREAVFTGVGQEMGEMLIIIERGVLLSKC